MSKLPIYEQVANKIKSDVAIGSLLPGEQLLSVRSMAIQEGVNPNTIVKAYQLLEREGFIIAVPNKGNFISSDAHKLYEVQKKDVLEKLKTISFEALKLGIKKEEIVKEVKELVNEYEA